MQSFRRRAGALFAAAPVAILLALSAAAQDGDAIPALRVEASVERDIITLGDLVENCGAACERGLFRAPAPGETGTIQALRVLVAARDAGLATIDTRGLTQIVVTRAGRAASREEIDGALAQALAQRVGIDAGELSVTLDQGLPRVAIAPGATNGPAVADLVIDTRTKRFAATLSAPRSRAASTRVSGSYAETVAAPVLTRSMQRGDAVRMEDLTIERRDRDSIGEEAPADPRRIVGRVTRTALRAGVVLRDRDLVKPLIVDRNSAVSMSFDSGALQLTLRGKAMEQGALGDVISVQNISSKRIVQGVIVGPGMVRFQSHAPETVARTASTQ